MNKKDEKIDKKWLCPKCKTEMVDVMDDGDETGTKVCNNPTCWFFGIERVWEKEVISVGDYVEERNKEELKATFFICLLIFLIGGIGIGLLLFKEIIITWTTGFTCTMIVMWKWIKNKYG